MAALESQEQLGKQAGMLMTPVTQNHSNGRQSIEQFLSAIPGPSSFPIKQLQFVMAVFRHHIQLLSLQEKHPADLKRD